MPGRSFPRLGEDAFIEMGGKGYRIWRAPKTLRAASQVECFQSYIVIRKSKNRDPPPPPPTVGQPSRQIKANQTCVRCGPCDRCARIQCQLQFSFNLASFQPFLDAFRSRKYQLISVNITWYQLTLSYARARQRLLSEPADLTIAQALAEFVPLSKLMAEQINGLRDWANGRACKTRNSARKKTAIFFSSFSFTPPIDRPDGRPRHRARA